MTSFAHVHAVARASLAVELVSNDKSKAISLCYGCSIRLCARRGSCSGPAAETM